MASPPPHPKSPPLPLPALSLPVPLPPPVAAVQPPFGIPNSRAKVLKTVLGFIFFALVLFACGGIINPRWVGWCLIGVASIALISE